MTANANAASMHQAFSELDVEEEEAAPDTVPIPGSSKLVIEDACIQLFISAEWTLTGTVNDVELGRSSTIKQPHTVAFTKRWARQLIRQNKERLRRLGVDVPATYVQWGGILADLA